MSLLYSFLLVRIGNRVGWYDPSGQHFIGKLASVEATENTIIISINEIPDLSGDYWNGGSYLPTKVVITVSADLTPNSISRYGSITLIAYGGYEDVVIKPFSHWESFDRI